MNARVVDRPGLLVSVRSAEEAAAALGGGADLIDVKEPSRGSLGRADDATIAAVVRAVAGRRPVSAALGDLPMAEMPSLCGADLAYVKWGLAGWGHAADAAWYRRLEAAQADLRARWPLCRLILVAYADWQRAESPSPSNVRTAARNLGCDGLLLDTFGKDGSTLLDWMTIAQVAELTRHCRDADLAIALAGSLGAVQIEQLIPLRPTWFAVRGAACRHGRDSAIDVDGVRQLVQLLVSTPETSSATWCTLGEPRRGSVT